MSLSIRTVTGLVVAALLLNACTVADRIGEGWANTIGQALTGVLEAADCSSLRIDEARGAPFDTIDVDGWTPLPAEDTFLLARYEAASTDPVVVVVDDHSEQVRLPVPVHPGDPAGGGTTTVTFGILDDSLDDSLDDASDEARTSWCDDTFEVAIDGLPDEGTAGSAAEELTRVLTLLDEALEPWDTTAAQLQRLTPEQVDAELAPAYVVARLALDPDGLPGLLDELDADERDLADRLVARLSDQHDPGTELDRHPGVDVQAAAATPHPAVTLASLRTGGGPGGVPALPVQSDAGSSAGPQACIATTLPDLSALVGYQLSGSTMISGAPGVALDTAMLLAGVPYLGRVGLPTVLLAWMTKTASAMLEGMLPSTLSGASVSSSPDLLWEDDVDGGLVEEVSLTFTSTGWDSGPALLELVTILADQGLSRAVQARLQRIVGRADRGGLTEAWQHDQIVELFASSGGSALQDAAVAAQTELIAELTSWIVTTFVSELISSQGWVEGRSALSTEPRCWRATSRAPDLDEMIEISYLDAIEEGFIPEQFLAREIGTGLIAVEVELPIGQHLLGPVGAEARDATATFTSRDTVEVLAIELVWDPAEEVVSPGDVVALNLQIHHAHDGRVRVTDSLGTLDRELTPTDGGIIFYTVPDDWDEAGPILVTAQSLSTDGLRRPSHPGYRGEIARSATLLPEGAPALAITPPAPCVEPGETVTLRAVNTADPTSDVEVVWTAGAGSISAAGVLRTPGQPGEVEVTATAVADEAIAATTVVQVGTCEVCTFEVEVDGLLGDVPRVTYDHTNAPPPPAPFLPTVPTIGVADWTTGAIDGVGVPHLGASTVSGPDSGAVVVTLYGEPFQLWEQFRGRFNRADEFAREGIFEGTYENLPVEGWRNPEATMTLDVERREIAAYRSELIEIPAYPVLHVRGEITGPVLVGRRLTGWQGPSPATTSRFEGEPIAGQVTIRFEGTFQPPSEDWPHPEFDPSLGPDAFGSDAPPGLLRTFDLDATSWCGPVHVGLDSRGDGEPAPMGGVRPPATQEPPRLPALPSLPGS